MSKSSVPFCAVALVVILSLFHRLVEAVAALAPAGYEDDEGFHFESSSQLK
jgi:hypothetical protein